MPNLFPKARIHDKTRSSAGFTLIELLVVITIIVLLVSLLIPSVQNIANLGYQRSCFMNMKKIGELNQEYATTYNGYVVPASWTWNPPSGPSQTFAFEELLRELNTTQTAPGSNSGANVFQCPAGPAGWLGIGTAYPGSATQLPLYPHDPDPPSLPTDGASYAINIHQNGATEPTWEGASWVPGVIFVNGTANSTRSNYVGLKTSQWVDPGGTIFLFETWRNGGWRDPSCAADITWDGGPMIAAFNGGVTKGLTQPSFKDAINLWQEKHVGKANLLFCDEHCEAKYIGDTMGPGETVKTQGVTYSGNLGTSSSCYTVRGMWTHAAGD